MQNELLLIEIFGILVLGCLLFFSSSFREIFILSLKKETTAKAERNRAIDFSRGIAMIAIVLIHVDSYFQFFHPNDWETYFSRFIANLGRFCVPAFIFSSAFFLNFKSSNEYWSSKFKAVVIPYLIIAIFGYFTKYPAEEFFNTISLKLITGSIFQPYYYVPLLFQFYILYAIFFKNSKDWSVKFFTILILLSAILNFWSNHFFPKTNSIFRVIEVISFTNFVFFFTLGLSAKKTFLDKNLFIEKFYTTRSIMILSLSVILYLIPVSYYTFKNKIEISNHFLYYPIVLFLLITLLGLKFELKYPKFFKIVSYIGENSLAVFLLHPMVIHLMHSFDPYMMGGFFPSYILTTILNILLPLLIWKLCYGAFDKIFSKTS
jgi:fucose 4-O-acetylase-like acetyltransferase